ncbi:GumC family protein [Persicimonas caeni]|uniref:GumC family protein n=1 Tax=Persicimonas caeni TaxID=2292766 RepID=UPI00143DD40A|nr:polysaccharide biosynthesis tyrosine autokinase [Persicimonas caeni]
MGELVAHYWSLVKRYYWILVLAAIVGIVGAYLWTKQQPKIYRAQSKIIFHESKPNLFGRQIERVEMLDPGGRWQFDQFWNTQKEVFRSNWFAERVVENVGLLDHPDFLNPLPGGKQRSREERLKAAREKVMGMFKVSLQRDSRVAIVSVTATDPELAAKLSNGLADTYVEYTHEVQSGGLNQLVNWFDSYVSTKKKELDAAQNKLQQFKRKHNILSLSYEDRQNLTANNMSTVNEQLMKVRTELSSEEALLSQIRDMEKAEEDMRAITALVENEALASLFDREAKLEQDLARLQTKYLDNHPEVQAVTNQLDTVREAIQEDIDRIRTAVENRVQVLRRHEGNLESELARLKKDVFALNELGVEYSQLKNDADSVQKLYETVLGRSSELNINSMYDSDLIQVLEHADVPEAPVGPNTPMNMALGLVAGLALGIGMMVLRDTLDTTVKSEEDVSRVTDKPVLAMLPELDRSVLKTLEPIGESPADTITHTAPKSSFAEGIKTLRTNLMFMAPDNPPKLLLVTSPGPGEGKTLSSVNMAIAMAQSGQRTLIIDADLRRPRVHKALGVPSKEQGVSTVILDRISVDEAIQKTQVPNLEVMTCGEVPPNPSELLHSTRFHELVDELRGRYDRVIFDSPPLAAVSDALVLSQVVDGVLLILKFGQTQRELLRRSVEQLNGIGAPFMGVVFNEIGAGAAGYRYSYYYRYSYEQDQPEGPSKIAS